MIRFNGDNYNSKLNNNFKASEKKRENMNDIQNLVKKVIDAAERQITDVGHFSVSVEQKNSHPFKYLSSYGVSINPDSPADKAMRVVKFFAKNESETYSHESGNKFVGTRDEVLDYLKSGDFSGALEDYVNKVSDKFYMDNNR